jgi:hypothetical protein
MPNSNQFTTIWDQYMIVEVEVTFAFNPTPTAFPTMIVARDDDNANVPASANVVTQYANARLLPFSPHKTSYTLKWRPRPNGSVLVALPSAPGTGNQWIDCGSPNQAHYGLVCWAVHYNTGITGQGGIDYYETLTVLFRGQR